MGNCLKTQLKETVQNSKLSVIGELRLQNIGNAPAWINFGYGLSVKTVTVINGYFTNEDGTENYGNTRTTPAGDETSSNAVWLSSGAILCLPDKYELKKILLRDDVYFKYWDFEDSSFVYLTQLNYLDLSGLYKSLDLATLKALSSLISFTCKGGNVFGDIANLNNLSNIKGTVELAYNNKITGSITAFANWRNVNTLIIDGTTISGSINELGNAMYNGGNGRVSGTLSISCSTYGETKPLVTYTDPNTQEIKEIDICTLTFSSSGVTYSPIYKE